MASIDQIVDALLAPPRRECEPIEIGFAAMAGWYEIRAGGGRKPLIVRDGELQLIFEAIVEHFAMVPEYPLSEFLNCWTDDIWGPDPRATVEDDPRRGLLAFGRRRG